MFGVGSLCATQYSQNAKSDLQQLIDTGGLTFYNDYQSPGVNANFSVGDGTATFTRASDATHPATYIDSNGVIQLVTTDVPRYAGGYYDATGFHSAKGLMVEAARTNLLQDSYFANGTTTYWRANGTGTVTNDATYTNPYLSGKCEKVVSGGSQYDGFKTAVAAKVPTSASTNYTVSALVRGSGTVKILCGIDGSDSYGTTTYTLSDSWMKISNTFAQITGSAGNNVGIVASDTSACTFYVAIIQIEASPYATSFIPTTTAALTRNPSIDSGVNSGNSTAAEETIIMKVMPEWSATALTASTYLYDTDTKSRAVYVGTDDFVHFQPNATDTAGATVSSTTKLAVNTSYVIAVVCKSTGNPNQEIYINGVSEASDNTDFTAPAWGTNFYVGCKADGTSQGNLIYQKIVKFNRALTATEVASVTDLLEG